MEIKDNWVHLAVHLLIIMLLFWVLLFLAMESYQLSSSVSACWGFLILADMTAIFAAIVVLPKLYPATLQKLLRPFWPALFSKPSGEVPDPRLRETIVELAQLSFTLEDSEAPEDLEDYLTRPMMEPETATELTTTSSEASRQMPTALTEWTPNESELRRRSTQTEANPETTTPVSPRQMIEDLVLNETAAIEKKFSGQVSVKSVVRPGSLVVLLTFCGTAYVVLSQYHDVIESIQMLRQQVRRAYQTISQGYQDRTGRNTRTRSEAVINDLSAATTAASSPANPSSTTVPNTISNTVAPSLAGDSVSVEVGRDSDRSSFIGCLTLFALLAILVLLLLIGYCEYAGETGVCSTIFSKIMDLITRVLLDLGAFFSGLGQMLTPGS